MKLIVSWQPDNQPSELVAYLYKGKL